MFKNANWIGTTADFGSVCPVFARKFTVKKEVKGALLRITAIGVYEAKINGERIGDFIFAPGLTAYETRIQYQTYDITKSIKSENELRVTVGTGWHRGRISANSPRINGTPAAVIAELEIQFTDGTSDTIASDELWTVFKSRIISSDIYDGEIYDATAEEGTPMAVSALKLPKDILIRQEGEYVREQERIFPARFIVTPKGEKVIDFGQNIAGYPEFSVNARKGDRVSLSFAEILDSDGCFYTDNYRGAKARLEYICRDGKQTFKPHFTFCGFRYIRIDEFPSEADLNDFAAIAVYSDMKRTGAIVTSNEKVNRLCENAIWSHRANFIDIPTDCPQRDERMGWTGDAQMFCKAASYNYDVKKFFAKWLADVRAQQREDGSIPDTVPNFWQLKGASAAWGDVICVVPWQMYLMYGDTQILSDNFCAMKKWVDYIGADTKEKYLWISDNDRHYGDWLALDAPYGSYKGATDNNFIASAFYAYSTMLVVKAGAVLGEDVRAYKELYENILKAFKMRFNEFKTQTECVLALFFGLTDKKRETADMLAKMIADNGYKLKTGFVGTPYLLYALSENGYADTAYRLLLQEEHPSWLYEVNHGATTIWEHWDGIRDDGKLWSADMNSYNHYAYGAVIDWIYSVAAGIKPDENCSGFERVVIEPHPNPRLEWLNVSLDTAHGIVRVRWTVNENDIRYEIETPVETRITIDNKTRLLTGGRYVLFGSRGE